MEKLIIIIVMMFAVGCGKSEVEKLEAENRRLQAELDNKKLKSDWRQKTKSINLIWRQKQEAQRRIEEF